MPCEDAAVVPHQTRARGLRAARDNLERWESAAGLDAAVPDFWWTSLWERPAARSFQWDKYLSFAFSQLSISPHFETHPISPQRWPRPRQLGVLVTAKSKSHPSRTWHHCLRQSSLVRTKHHFPASAGPPLGIFRVVVILADGTVQSTKHPQCEPLVERNSSFLGIKSPSGPCSQNRPRQAEQRRDARLGHFRSTFLTRGSAHHQVRNCQDPAFRLSGATVGGPIPILLRVLAASLWGSVRADILESETTRKEMELPVVGRVARRRG
jgi:hypothetical protein